MTETAPTVEMLSRWRNGLMFCLILLCLQSTTTVAFKASSPTGGSLFLCRRSICDKNKLNRVRSNFVMRSRDSPSALHAFFDGKSNTESATLSVGNVNKLFLRCSWISWWFQIVLSIISAVILTFANTVRRAGSSQSLWASGFSFSAIGVIIAFVNCFCTFASTRLSRRISGNKIEVKKIFPTLKRYCKTSVIVSLVGLLVSLIGAEQIVGNLASKVLTSQGTFIPVVSTGGAMNALQALDIFLVQANTNVLVAQFVPLVANLFLQSQIPLQGGSGLNLSDLQGEKDVPEKRDDEKSSSPIKA